MSLRAGGPKLCFLPMGQPNPSIFVSFYSRGPLPSPRWHRDRDPAPVFQGDGEVWSDSGPIVVVPGKTLYPCMPAEYG